MSDNGKTYICPSCAGELEYDPTSKGNICIYCGTSYVINKFRDFEDFRKDKKMSNCSNCGENIIYENQKTAICKSCGSKFNIITDREVFDDDIEECDLVSPFELSSETAYEKMIRELGNNPDIPLDLFKKIKIIYSTSLYFPALIVSFDFDAKFSAKIGFDHWENYTEFVKEGGRSVAKKKQRRVTEWQSISDDISGNWIMNKNIAHELKDKSGTTLLEFQHALDQLCENGIGHTYQDYSERYLAGYHVTKMDYDSSKIIRGMLPGLEVYIRKEVNDFISADHIENVNFRYDYKTDELRAYFPAFLYKVNYESKDYFISQTGENGMIFGSLPKDLRIQKSIKNIMVPFWIYLVFSIILFMQNSSFGALMILGSIPVWFIMNSIRKTKTKENYSNRQDQVEKFLSGSIHEVVPENTTSISNGRNLDNDIHQNTRKNTDSIANTNETIFEKVASAVIAPMVLNSSAKSVLGDPEFFDNDLTQIVMDDSYYTNSPNAYDESANNVGESPKRPSQQISDNTDNDAMTSSNQSKLISSTLGKPEYFEENVSFVSNKEFQNFGNFDESNIRSVDRIENIESNSNSNIPEAIFDQETNPIVEIKEAIPNNHKKSDKGFGPEKNIQNSSRDKKKAFKIKMFYILVFILLSILVIGGISTQTIFKKDISYYFAVREYNKGNYVTALEKFNNLNGFKESEIFIRNINAEANYQLANSYYLNTEFRKASDLYKSLNTYKDSVNFYFKSNYELAQEFYLNGDYNNALNYFNKSNSIFDTSKKIEDCTVQIIVANLDADPQLTIEKLSPYKDTNITARKHYFLSLDKIFKQRYENGSTQGSDLRFLLGNTTYSGLDIYNGLKEFKIDAKVKDILTTKRYFFASINGLWTSIDDKFAVLYLYNTHQRAWECAITSPCFCGIEDFYGRTESQNALFWEYHMFSSIGTDGEVLTQRRENQITIWTSRTYIFYFVDDNTLKVYSKSENKYYTVIRR